ncbi:MAG: transporter [Lachnospiraceae bacterium]|nr:transporter [Lachnospiraceae bacterium]
MKKKVSIKDLLMLQIVFLIYSVSSLVAKFASGNDVMSFKFIMFYGLELVILGIYAILWQQVIKKFELSVAYANKAICLLWALVWSIVIFHDDLKWNQVVGIVIVMAGIVILNSEPSKDDKEKEEA